MLGPKKRLISSLILCSLSQGAYAALYNLEEPHRAREIIIKFKNDPDFDREAYLRANNLETITSFMSGALLVRSGAEESTTDFRQTLTQLADHEYVAYVETNSYLHTLDVTPNDPQFAQTYAMKNSGQSGGKIGADIAATKAWQLSQGSAKTLVAVIDTGIDYTHPDLKENYWTNPGESGLDAQGRDKRTNGIDDDGNGFIDDWRGWNFVGNNNNPFDDNEHGSHCAGTIGARGNNGIGVAGVNWNVSLVGIKFLDAAGSGTLADAVKSLEYAIKIKANITSNSWGGGGYSPTMDETIGIANTAGILFIAAAGNIPSNNDSEPHYPSNYARPNVIAVAATDHNDQIANFSSFGPSTVHLAAPGVQIFSTIPGNKYKLMSGTSMATPHVAGAAALIKSLYPDMGHLQIKERLLASVDHLPSLDDKVSTQGRLNVYNALIDDRIPPNEVEQLSIFDIQSSRISLRFSPSGDNGHEGKAARYRAKISRNPITSIDEWQKAQDIVLHKDEQGGFYTIKQLPFNYAGYLAIRAFDKVGNGSPVSGSLAFTLLPTTVYAQFVGDSLLGFTAESPWGLESVPQLAGTSVFSDSPGASYGNNINKSLTTPSVKLPTNSATVVLETNFDIEANFDFCYLELSQDKGLSWKKIKALTGKSSGWERIYVDLKKHLSSTIKPLLLRFRMSSDYSVAKDGIKIKTIQFVGP